VSRKPHALPDLDDATFKARLAPLASAVVPGTSVTRTTNAPDNRNTDTPASIVPSEAPSHEEGSSALSPAPVVPAALTEVEVRRGDPFSALRQVEQARQARGPRKGIEFLLPDRVTRALRARAAEDGVSMSVKLLEALRNSGYPVIDEDFVDLRKLPKR
jgi:hypothetical protein